MNLIPNTDNVRCFEAIHPHDDPYSKTPCSLHSPNNELHVTNGPTKEDDNKISRVLIAQANQFMYVDSTDFNLQNKLKDIKLEPKQIVYNMKLDC